MSAARRIPVCRRRAATVIWREVVAWNQEVHGAVYRELNVGRLPDSTRRRPQPEHRLHLGRRTTLPRSAAPAASDLARCACRFQYARHEPERQPARHAGRVFVRIRSERTRTRWAVRRRPSCRSGCVRSESAASIRAKGASCTSNSLRCSTCATSTRWASEKPWNSRLQDLPKDTHLHVSFDVDFLDPEIAPGVGTTVAGGMSYREAQLCMEMIADTGRSPPSISWSSIRPSMCATRRRRLQSIWSNRCSARAR